MFKHIIEAAKRLEGVAHRTPVMRSRTLDAHCGSCLFLKCENFQRAGAFKFRGAYNAIHKLTDEKKRKGVVTYSSGNHAQAAALVGQLLGVPTTIVMPSDAPRVKLAATRGYGAQVVLYDRATERREDIAQRLIAEHGYTLIPPFDHLDVVAGQGTCAKELIEDMGELDALLVPCGGGGLLSGSAISAKHLSPHCQVIGVEPEQADDATRSFRTGTLQAIHHPDTIADGVRTTSLGNITFPLVLQYVDEMVTVSETDILRAMYFLWTRMKLVVEPSGAVGLAALFSHRVDLPGQRVGVILSGGNVDLQTAYRLFGTLADAEEVGGRSAFR